jgi:hypothetical protein
MTQTFSKVRPSPGVGSVIKIPPQKCTPYCTGESITPPSQSEKEIFLHIILLQKKIRFD